MVERAAKKDRLFWRVAGFKTSLIANAALFLSLVTNQVVAGFEMLL